MMLKIDINNVSIVYEITLCSILYLIILQIEQKNLIWIRIYVKNIFPQQQLIIYITNLISQHLKALQNVCIMFILHI